MIVSKILSWMMPDVRVSITPLVGGLLAGGSILGGLIGSRGAQDAADTAASAQERATDAAVAENRRQFDVVQGLQQPAIDARNTALGRLEQLLDTGGPEALEALRNTPGYQFIVDEATRGVNAFRNATGQTFGGGTLDQLTRLRAGLADQTFNSRVAQEMARAGLGSAGANVVSGAAQGFGGLNSQLLQSGIAGAGAARAAGTVGSTNSIGNALNNISYLAGLYGPQIGAQPAVAGQAAASVVPPVIQTTRNAYFGG